MWLANECAYSWWSGYTCTRLFRDVQPRCDTPMYLYLNLEKKWETSSSSDSAICCLEWRTTVQFERSLLTAGEWSGLAALWIPSSGGRTRVCIRLVSGFESSRRTFQHVTAFSSFRVVSEVAVSDYYPTNTIQKRPWNAYPFWRRWVSPCFSSIGRSAIRRRRRRRRRWISGNGARITRSCHWTWSEWVNDLAGRFVRPSSRFRCIGSFVRRTAQVRKTKT